MAAQTKPYILFIMADDIGWFKFHLLRPRHHGQRAVGLDEIAYCTACAKEALEDGVHESAVALSHLPALVSTL